MNVEAYEKLGVFYLGRHVDPETAAAGDAPLLYDARHLTTHGVIIGMTGSGKTGLAISLLEEAAIDGVPVIAIDPKGDLTNLALTFPELRAEDFRPWVNVEEAAARGVTPDELAAAAAADWRQGLAAWDQPPERIARLRAAAPVTIYTPGSSAGRGVSLLASFRAPQGAARDDEDLLREKVEATATSLLALLGIDADPLQAREHILVANLLSHAWRAGRDLDLATLLAQIDAPPFARLGVMEVDTFYPRKDRLALAMRLNALLAAPGFAAWLEGEPLDVQRFLYTPDGAPRVSIFAIHHLDDAARMSFVSLLLSEVLAWTRSQPGTTSLRALLYMDEVFGYFPPVANPPAKRPLLTLLKQARAFGLGVVLATQNPVDLDYKGLSNTGTWFIGRLQTDRDKQRVLDALEGATAGSAAPGRKELERLLGGLGKRVFLLHDVHAPGGPALFHTRWALSYLRGPLTREQVRSLGFAAAAPAAAPVPAPVPGAAAAVLPAAAPTPAPSPSAPVPPAPAPSTAPGAGAVPARYAPVRGPAPAGATLAWGAVALAAAELRYSSRRPAFELARRETLATGLPADGVPDWAQGEPVALDPACLGERRPEEGLFGEPPRAALDPARWAAWQRTLARDLAAARPLALWHAPRFDLASAPGETEGDLRARLAPRVREERDRAFQQLRERFGPKLRRLRERIDKAQATLAAEAARTQADERALALDVGASVVGALFGRGSFGATSLQRVARASGRAATPSRAAVTARAALETARGELAALDREFHEELDRVAAAHDAARLALEPLELRAKPADVTVDLFTLGWLPFWRDARGELTPAWVAGQRAS
jgi:hypothetical protein